jgi:hypothetical protein
VNFIKDSGDVRWEDIEAGRAAGEVTLGAPIPTTMR